MNMKILLYINDKYTITFPNFTAAEVSDTRQFFSADPLPPLFHKTETGMPSLFLPLIPKNYMHVHY
jgi:hypothetical protein